MILHHISDDAEFVEVAASPMGAEWFLESDLHRGYIVPVPCRIEYSVSESQGHQILHHLLAEIVIYTINLLLAKERRQMIRELLRRGGVATERFLDYNSRPSSEILI